MPVIEPGDPEAVDKLEALLKLNPVSRRLEVLAVMVEDYTVRALGCAYVTSEAHPVATYLGDLARQRIGDLPDPTFETPVSRCFTDSRVCRWERPRSSPP